MLDSFTVPAWTARIVTQLLDSAFVELALVVLNDEQPSPRPALSWLRAPRRDRLLFGLYRRVDQQVFKTEPNAFAPVSLGQVLDSVPVLAVTPLRPRLFEHRFDGAAIAGIEAARLDVLLRFGFRIIRGEILRSARFGVWSYHHGDSRHFRGGPDFFWEMYERKSVTGTELHLLTEELDGGPTLYRSFAATDSASLYRGRNRAYWKSAEFVMRRLTDLHQRGWDYVQARPEYCRTAYSKPIYRTPTNRQMVVFLTRLCRGMAKRQARKLVFRDTWQIMYRRAGDGGATVPARTQADAANRLANFRELPSAPGHWYADPFLARDRDRYHMFCEAFDVSRRKATIASTSIDDHGVVEAPRIVLERSYQLSYPLVFRWNDDWYMLPETRERRAVELFKAVRFPERWEFERLLLHDLDVVDATIFEHDGRLWLLANVAAPGAAIEDELCLFYADSLHEDWTPHPMNPIVSDVRRARPAGRVLSHDGQLIRPSQDCSERYGQAIAFNRIVRLTPTEYEEEPIGRLEPKSLCNAAWTHTRAALGTHTFNAEGEYEVIDVERTSLALLSWVRARATTRRQL
jgi:hypothetical protein